MSRRRSAAPRSVACRGREHVVDRGPVEPAWLGLDLAPADEEAKRLDPASLHAREVAIVEHGLRDDAGHGSRLGDLGRRRGAGRRGQAPRRSSSVRASPIASTPSGGEGYGRPTYDVGVRGLSAPLGAPESRSASITAPQTRRRPSAGPRARKTGAGEGREHVLSSLPARRLFSFRRHRENHGQRAKGSSGRGAHRQPQGGRGDLRRGLPRDQRHPGGRPAAPPGRGRRRLPGGQEPPRQARGRRRRHGGGGRAARRPDRADAHQGRCGRRREGDRDLHS